MTEKTLNNKSSNALERLIESKVVALVTANSVVRDQGLYSFILQTVERCLNDFEIKTELDQYHGAISRQTIVKHFVEGFLCKTGFSGSTAERDKAELEGKVVIEYVAIRIISKSNTTLYSEYSLHRPNRHENIKDQIVQMTGKKPDKLGEVIEGFKTDEGAFLTRREAMSIYRAGNLLNRVRFDYGKAHDTDMQSIYLW